MNDNKVLFVDLDGTLIKEDLSDLAFSHSLKNFPIKTLFYSFIFLEQIRGSFVSLFLEKT